MYRMRINPHSPDDVLNFDARPQIVSVLQQLPEIFARAPFTGLNISRPFVYHEVSLAA
jgi:hypothetical protein